MILTSLTLDNTGARDLHGSRSDQLTALAEIGNHMARTLNRALGVTIHVEPRPDGEGFDLTTNAEVELGEYTDFLIARAYDAAV